MMVRVSSRKFQESTLKALFQDYFENISEKKQTLVS